MAVHQDIPQSVLSYLHEYDPGTVNLEDHKWVLVERILQSGTREDVRWLFSRFPKEDIIDFLRRQGNHSRLSYVNLNFWLKFFNLPKPPKQSNPIWNY